MAVQLAREAGLIDDDEVDVGNGGDDWPGDNWPPGLPDWVCHPLDPDKFIRQNHRGNDAKNDEEGEIEKIYLSNDAETMLSLA